jgi:hypothetical protein
MSMRLHVLNVVDVKPLSRPLLVWLQWRQLLSMEILNWIFGNPGSNLVLARKVKLGACTVLDRHLVLFSVMLWLVE